MGKVEKWIEAKKAAKAAKAASGAQGKPRTALNVRVTDLRMGMVAELAKEMGMTRSGFAEQLIDLAIAEAWEKYNGREATLGDIKRLEAMYTQQQIKPPVQAPSLVPVPSSLLEGSQQIGAPGVEPDALSEMMTKFALGSQKPAPPAPVSESSGLGNGLLAQEPGGLGNLLGLGRQRPSLLPSPKSEPDALKRTQSMLEQFLKEQK